MRYKAFAVMPLLAAGVMCLAISFDSLSRNPRVGPVVSPQGFHEVARYKLGGEGGWVYLTMDSASRRLYISRGTRVVVINIDNGSVVGEIPNTNGVHGIALAFDAGKGFVSDGRDNKVTMFDLKTLKPTGEVKTGQNPDAIIYDDGSKRVFAFNGGSSYSSPLHPPPH